MANSNNDLVLLSSFLQNEQVEKNNSTLRIIHDLFTKKSTDTSILTRNLELSLSELKERQLDQLKALWSNTVYPSQTISHMIKLHSAYTDELIVQENMRLIECAEFIKYEKLSSATPSDVNAESLGLNTSRRPPKRLPPTNVRTESGANYGIDPQTGKNRSTPLLYPTPVLNLKEVQDVLIFLPNTQQIDFRPSIEQILKRGQLLGFGERHYDSVFKLFIQQHFFQYSGIFQNGITADETFLNLLVVFRSHDVSTTLKDSLKQFSRLPNQSFTEFATILCALACRTVRETHLQMSESEAAEFAKDKLMNHLTPFTGLDVR